MIPVDSSVGIDYFRGSPTPERERLDALPGMEPIAIGDLILVEVLHGFTSDQAFNQAKKLLTALVVTALGGQDLAIQAAKNSRVLRALGITVRKTTDTVMATRCIESGFTRLHADRDSEPFATPLGLRSVF